MSRNKNYLLNLLLAILAFNCVDRLVLGLVLQDIKVDLALTDTQLGFLSGIAFALFYSLMGIPIARWADRGNRVTIISLTLALWSVAVTLCGMAASFVQLMLIRIGVAVGEAGCVPPAHSLIADYFDRNERPRALARYMLGPPLSAVIGYAGAGWLNARFGWRMMFVLMGIPGILLAALAWYTLREPRVLRPNATADHAARTPSQPGPTRTSPQPDLMRTPLQPGVMRTSAQPGLTHTPSQPDLKSTFLALWKNRTFRHLLIANSVLCFFGYGVANWQPAFFIRRFGMDTAEIGLWLAMIWGGGGLLGAYLGGELASRYAASNERLQLRYAAAMQCGFGVISALIYIVPNAHVSFALLAIAALGAATTTGPLYAAIQTLVPENMRAMSIALVYLFANLIGMGLGPLAVGVLSDVFRPFVADDSLRYALLALCPGFIWVAWHLMHASRSVMRDLRE